MHLRLASSQPSDGCVQVVKTEDGDFMAKVLAEVDSNHPGTALGPNTPKTEQHGKLRNKARALSPAPEPMHKRRKRVDTLSSSPLPANMDSDDGFMQSMIDDDEKGTNDVLMSDPAPSSPAAKVAQRKAQIKQEPQNDDDEDIMEVAHAGTVETSSVNLAGSRPVKKVPKPDPYPSPANSSPPKPAPESNLDSSSWNDLTERLNVVASPLGESRGIGKMDHMDAVEADGSLNLFWTDYVEVNGSLCLFGKVLDRKSRSYVSCFVKIDNILRKLYFLPRQRRMQDGVETGEEVDMTDVYGEMDDIMTKMNVPVYKIKKCSRKYAFELPGVPKEAQYLKLLYPYTSKFVLDSSSASPRLEMLTILQNRRLK